MCGIAGFVGGGGRRDLIAMTQALAHRGPDGNGHFVDAERNVYLGHRRLAIIDIAGGAQPMGNERGDVHVVYNGEIYNHLELRAELRRCGYRFQTDHCDTEVLVHGYDAWGEDLPLRLNGMFAFAVYDERRRRLFLARDRFGEKPVYYMHKRGAFAFASELSALLEHPGVSGAVNAKSLQKFFAYGYLPAPNALYENCYKLPGGCHLTLDIDSGEASTRRYWRFQLEPDEALTEADDEPLAEELRALMLKSVQRRLMSDVPLGVFLSGGIDSGAVLAGATAQLGRERVATYTIGFNEPSFDESIYARRLAGDLGSIHHEHMLDMERARDMIQSVLGRLDEPMGDASIVPTHLLSAFARRDVTVALSGDGGDELFAGYDPFMALGPAQIYDRLMPSFVHRGMRRLADMLPISTANMSLDFKLRRTLSGLSYPAPLWNAVWMAPLEPRDLKDVFCSPLDAEELYSETIELWQTGHSHDPIDKTLEFFTNFYLQDDILMKSDRAAMMSSLETRAIFLDNDVVDFCRRLPNRFKFRRGERKFLLRRALRPLLPRWVFDRPKKGFGIPLASWLRTVPETAPLAPVDGVDMENIAGRWSAHRAGRADHRLFLWSWLSLQATLSGRRPQAGTLAAVTRNAMQAEL